MGSDNIFRIDFYPKDWLIDTSRLPPDIRGNFIQIVCLIYAQGGAIENDNKWIAGVCGCSSRLVKSHVDYLVENNFLILQKNGKLSQKRAENELKTKRTHLERSSNGGRTSSENKRQSNKNSDLASSESDFPVRTPSPLPSILKHQSKPTAREETEQGVLKMEGGKKNFSIDRYLTDPDRELARKAAPRWDIHHLSRVYDEGINSGTRPAPKHPARAFIAWLPIYTKGKIP